MKSKVWEFIKNAFILIGGVWVCIQMFNFISSKGSKLTAYIDETEYPISSYFSDSFNSAERESDRLVKLAFDSKDSTTKARLFDSAKNTIKYKLNPYDQFQFNTLVIINLENTGDKELSGIKVIPKYKSTFIYEFKYGGKSIYGKTAEKLEIGNMSPSEKLNIYIWSNSSFDKEDYNVIHSEGRAKIRYYSRMKGISAAIGNFVSGPFLPMLLPLALILIQVIGSISKKKSDIEKQNEASTEDKTQVLKEIP